RRARLLRVLLPALCVIEAAAAAVNLSGRRVTGPFLLAEIVLAGAAGLASLSWLAARRPAPAVEAYGDVGVERPLRRVAPTLVAGFWALVAISAALSIVGHGVGPATATARLVTAIRSVVLLALLGASDADLAARAAAW